MKSKLIVFVLLLSVYLFLMCSPSDISTNHREEESKNNVTFPFGVKPSNPEQIEFIGFSVEESDFILLGGRKAGKAWIAKFTLEGQELFSIELDCIIGEQIYGHYNQNSLKMIDANTLFIMGWICDEDIVNSPTLLNAKVTAIFSSIDLNTGTECLRITGGDDNDRDFAVHTHSDFYYLVEEKMANNSIFHNFTMLDKNSEMLWTRPTYKSQDSWVDCEYNQGIMYHNVQFQIDGERIIDFNYRIINLKNYEIVHTLSLPIDGDRKGQPNIWYYRDSISFIDLNTIRFTYDEVERIEKTEYDEITGHTSTKYEYIYYDKYFIDIDKDFYVVVTSGKLSPQQK